MNEHFPELIDPAQLPRRVLCVAPHPDDEVIGCGGTLALHAARGDAVRVLLVTGSAERVAESRAAAAQLGVADVRCLDFEDGRLGAAYDLVGRRREECAEVSPELVYAPSAFEHHPDHLACHRAVVSALGAKVEVLCYGVNTGVSTPLPAGPVGLLVDIFHLYTSHADVAAVRDLPVKEVVNVHVNDAIAGRTPDQQIDNERALPGETGVCDIAGFMQALAAIGYDGPVTVEPFSQRVREMSPDDAVRATANSLRRAWAFAKLPFPE